MTEQKKVYTLDWAGRQLTVETGQFAKQANGAVLVRTEIRQYFQLQQLQKFKRT